MPASEIVNYLKQILRENVQSTIPSLEFSSVGGGSINETYEVKTGSNRAFFLKINSASTFPLLFQKEKNGLEFLAKQEIINIPRITQYSIVSNYQLLLLEWIDRGLKTETFWKNFGEQLARLHKKTNSHFGFEEDNYMGALSQRNDWSENWNDFFIQHRLQPQVRIAINKGLLSQKNIHRFEILYEKLNSIFDNGNASLLHGDLWSGNFICDEKSQPFLIDPAVYFGHRSMDLAMTTLFGGFDKSFYESYHYHFPMPDNYREQWDVCNLYPLLIHLNLFGSGYLYDIENILKKFVA